MGAYARSGSRSKSNGQHCDGKYRSVGEPHFGQVESILMDSMESVVFSQKGTFDDLCKSTLAIVLSTVLHGPVLRPNPSHPEILGTPLSFVLRSFAL